jgi:hypothetical protein
VNTHTLTIVKRTKDLRSPYPNRSNPVVYVDAESRATCSCGWIGDWKQSEEAVRNEFIGHVALTLDTI